MRKLLKLILINIIILLPGWCCASFEIYPQKLHICPKKKTSVLNVVNNTKTKTFTLTLLDSQTKKPTGDLSFSPASFSLKAGQKQVIRIMTKDKVNYNGKHYELEISTDEDNPAIQGKPGSFIIPITVGGVKTDTGEKSDTKANKSVNQTEADHSSSGGLTQIRIPIPVTATVNETD
jgi:hypothetical protein